MIQLQSRIAQYTGHPDCNGSWNVDDEATIITKSMRQTVRENRGPVEHGCREYRIVNTKQTPELAAQ